MTNQWTAPEEAPPAAGMSHSKWVYKPLWTWTRTLLATFVTIAAMEVLLTVLDLVGTFWWPNMFVVVEDGNPFSAIMPGVFTGLGLVLLGLIIATIPIWCVWHYRACANLYVLNRAVLTFSPAAQVYWWFVPFANLIMPYKATAELLRGAEASGDADAAFGTIRSQPGASMPLWWTLWLVGGFANQCSARLNLWTEYWEVGSIMGLIGTVGSVGAACFYMSYVWRIHRGVESQASEVNA